MKSMNAINAVQLLILVWTFTAVCQADDDIRVSCEDVTGTVRKEVTFTCSVSLKKSGCCIEFYKFQYPEIHKESDICKQNVSKGSQRNSFTCSFSSTTAIMGKFRFFLQTDCGNKRAEFTVDIAETSKPGPDTEDPGKKEPTSREKERREGDDTRSKNTVIPAVTGCFIIIIIIIIMTIIYKKKPNYSQSCGFQRRMFLCHKHDDNNSNFQEQNPENVI